MKKVFALVLALVMMLIAGTAFAADPTTGSITVEKNFEGQDYELYKLFDAEVTWKEDGTVAAINYKLPSEKIAADLKSGDKQWFKVNDLGFIEVYDESVTTNWAKDPDAKAWAKSFGTQVGDTLTATSDNDTAIKWEGLEFGYYLVDSTMGAYVSVDTTNPNQKVNDKNNPPSITKEITSVENGNVDHEGKNAIAQVGDTVNYTLTVAAKPGAENYVVTDTLSDGLTPPDADDVSITGLTAGDDYTVDVTEQDVTITFTKAYLDTIKEDKEITITYPAVLNDDAVIGETGNPNSVTLKWGHDPENETLPQETKVFTAKISVTKNDGNNEGLAGAEFALKNKDEKYYHLKSDGTVEWVDSVGSATKFISGDDGALSGEFTGLTCGDYTLEETVVPSGYNPIAADDVSLKFKIENAEFTDSNLIQSTTVINNAGTVLPSTGGIGTTIFYVVGGLLVIGAAVILIARRKVSE